MLVDSLHGLKRSDEELLLALRQHAISHQIILSKVDRVFFGNSFPSLVHMGRNKPELDAIIDKLKAQIQPGKGDGPEALGEILTCSAEERKGGKIQGINNVRWAVLAATGLSEWERKILPLEFVGEDAPLNTNHVDSGPVSPNLDSGNANFID